MHESNAATPRLSFVVPVYNPPGDVLDEALSSIAAQTATAWECVLVDDCSTDPGIRPQLDDWAARDGRFRVIGREHNGGIAEATNTGLDAARGDIVAFVDHDDLVTADAAEAVLDHFAAHPDDDIVYSDEQLVDADGEMIADYLKPDFSPVRFLGHNYFNHLVAIRRAAIGDVRVRSEFEPAQDADFLHRVIESVTAAGRTVGHIARVLYRWRAVEGSVALDATEKSGTADAVVKCMRAAAERRGLEADIEIVVHDTAPTTSVRIRFPAPDLESTELVPVTAADAEVAERVADVVATTDKPFVCLIPPGSEHDWVPDVAAMVARPDIAIAGPALFYPNGTIASTGRRSMPTLTDSFAYHGASAGPFGVFLVTHEVTAVAPLGAVLDVAAARAVGGLATDVGLDAGLAELSERLRRAGCSTVWTPNAEVTLDDELIAGSAARTAVDYDWAVCRQRLGGVPERFDPIGVTSSGSVDAPPIVRACELIASGDVDLVTSDVFDTIVTRHVATPSDLYLVLGRELAADGMLPPHVTPMQFALARRAAERAARRRLSDAAKAQPEPEPAPGPDREPECTIEEIWDGMPSGWFADPGEMIRRELDVEVRHLHPVEPALAALRQAHDRGVHVVLVSDIYLSGEQLDDVLTKCGVDTSPFERIVTSSDHRLGKADGLLARVIEEAGVEPRHTLHLGDNDDADIAAANEIGAIAIQTDLPELVRAVEHPPAPITRYSRRRATDGGISAAARTAWVAAGGDAVSPAYQFGVAAAGPALAGFARWVARTTGELGATSLHALLREGQTIAELIDVVAPDAPPTRLVHASRWVDLRAAVISGTTDEVHQALARRGPTSVSHVAAAFGVDPDVVRRVWGDTDAHHPVTLRDACSDLVADDELRAAIVSRAAELRARVMRQLRREIAPGVLDGSAGPLVICDVGWGATIQVGLERILAAEGVDVEVVGLYLAISEPGENKLAAGSRILSYLPNAAVDPEAARSSREIAHHADTVERLLMPATGTLIDLTGDGEPVLDARVDPHPPSLLAAKRGVFDMARALAAQGMDDEIWVGDLEFRGALAATLASPIAHPGRRLARDLADWPHDDVAGADAKPLGGSESAELMPYVTVRDLPMLRQFETAWLEGRAALTNPTLAAQFEAVRAGVDADLIAPGAATGRSLLAAFPVGSDLAHVQVEHHLGVTTDGWSVLRLTGDYPSLRSLRFDAGDAAALVEIRRCSVALTPNGAAPTSLVFDDLTASAIDWVGAWPIDARRYVETADGHLLIPVEAAVGASAGRLDATLVFRRWSLPDDDALLRPSWRWRSIALARRARRVAERRLR